MLFFNVIPYVTFIGFGFRGVIIDLHFLLNIPSLVFEFKGDAGTHSFLFYMFLIEKMKLIDIKFSKNISNLL